MECYSGYRYFQYRKKEYSYDRCPNPVYFNIPLSIINLSAIETLICYTEIEVNRAKGTATTVVCIIAPMECYSGYRYFQYKKKEYSYDRCPNPVYFNIPLSIINLSAIETLIC